MDDKNLRCSSYCTSFCQYLLNNKYFILSLGELLRTKTEIMEYFKSDGDLFVRPDSNMKSIDLKFQILDFRISRFLVKQFEVEILEQPCKIVGRIKTDVYRALIRNLKKKRKSRPRSEGASTLRYAPPIFLVNKPDGQRSTVRPQGSFSLEARTFLIKWAWRDSNPRPHGSQPCTLSN